MTVLTTKQREAGLSLAARDGELRWAWGDWALDVAGPVGEDHTNTGSQKMLADALAELHSATDGEVSILPGAEALRTYRDAADAIPPALRKAVRSIEAGRILGQRVKDRAERLALIEQLANDDGVVTVRAVRDHFGDAAKDGPILANALVNPEQRKEALGGMSNAQRVEIAREAMSDPEVAMTVTKEAMKQPEIATEVAKDKDVRKAIDAEEKREYFEQQEKRKHAAAQRLAPTPLSQFFWRIVTKVHDWSRELNLIRDEAGTLRPEQHDEVVKRLTELRDKCDECIDAVHGKVADDDVIEGRVHDIRELSA